MLSKNYSEQLNALGDSAIRSLDVPVAALVVYDNEVIGMGHNTVNRNGNIGGHAEINALSDAVIKLGGLDKFNALDRDKLALITTFEPCKMCEGAIIENFITHVIVVKMKPMKHWFQKKKCYIYISGINNELRKIHYKTTSLRCILTMTDRNTTEINIW